MIEKCRILFLRELPPLVSSIKRLDAVILSPGSTARDLNLLFLFRGGSFPTEEINTIAKKLEEDTDKQLGQKLTINAVPRNLPELDKYFLSQILRDGYVVYGDLPHISSADLNLKPMTIISYSLKNKTQKEKTKLNYVVYGRTLNQGKSKRIISGILQEARGTQLGPGVILIPNDSQKKIKDLFEKEKVQYTERDVWTDVEERA